MSIPQIDNVVGHDPYASGNGGNPFRGTRQWDVSSGQLLANQKITIPKTFIPDWWLVAIGNAVGIRVGVVPGYDLSSTPILIGGGGHVTIPSNGTESITIANLTANPVYYNAVALLGFTLTPEVDMGEIV